MFQTESALIYDAVKLLATAVQDLDQSQAVEAQPISCENGIPWVHGSSLINYMRPVINFSLFDPIFILNDIKYY
jgi:hypothetical protein